MFSHVPADSSAASPDWDFVLCPPSAPLGVSLPVWQLLLLLYADCQVFLSSALPIQVCMHVLPIDC